MSEITFVELHATVTTLDLARREAQLAHRDTATALRLCARIRLARTRNDFLRQALSDMSTRHDPEGVLYSLKGRLKECV